MRVGCCYICVRSWLLPSLTVLSLWLLEWSGMSLSREWCECECLALRLSASAAVSVLPLRVNLPGKTTQWLQFSYKGINKAGLFDFVPMMVACQPPRSRARRSSPRPEKLPNEKVLRVGETSRWSSWSRKGIPIRRCRFFPVWWKGMEPFLSRSSRRFLNWKVQNFPTLEFNLHALALACWHVSV